MQIGAHISIAGGVFNAPENARRIGCECFQMFTRSPRGGKAPELTDEVLEQFFAGIKKYTFKNYYVHAPYYINFASSQARIAKGSIEVIREELERSSRLGVKALMAHLGSAKDVGKEKAIKMTIDGIKEVLKGYKGSTQFLIENAAGAGEVIADSFEEIAAIIKGVESIQANKNKVGVCFDTCHGFSSGYDIRDKPTWDKTLKQFDELIGLKRLVVLHANDSKYDFDARRDRHDNIGKGFIGKTAFEVLATHPKLKNVDCILETPWVDGEKTIAGDIKLMKKFRKK